MTWTIIDTIVTTINTIVMIALIIVMIQNSLLQIKNRKRMDELNHQLKYYAMETEKSFDKQGTINSEQIKFNQSVTENIIRHEDALRIIVNYIKAG